MPIESNPVFHVPVLAKEVISQLEPKSPGCYLDGTVGGGGHARLILEASSPDGRLYGIDQDEEAIRAAAQALKPYGSRVRLKQGNFQAAREIYQNLAFNGILLDLGVSSHQLDTPGRGFSCDRDGPLDMRMDRRETLQAAYLLKTLSERELSRAFRDLGETHFSRQIAKAIVTQRAKAPVRTTSELAGMIRKAVPVRKERKSVVQVFQALRIMVNDELGALANGLKELFSMLLPGGRMAVISYHSLEDRIVKNYFAELVDPCICPPDLPVCGCGRIPQAKVLTRKPVRTSRAEIESNPRSRPALLRVAEKLNASKGRAE
jgi:16S rRNA (cytosine1402-N4)-methyltransferase